MSILNIFKEKSVFEQKMVMKSAHTQNKKWMFLN